MKYYRIEFVEYVHKEVIPAQGRFTESFVPSVNDEVELYILKAGEPVKYRGTVLRRRFLFDSDKDITVVSITLDRFQPC